MLCAQRILIIIILVNPHKLPLKIKMLPTVDVHVPILQCYLYTMDRSYHEPNHTTSALIATNLISSEQSAL